MKQLPVAVLLAVLLSACAPAAGVRIDNQQLSMIRQGYTTEQEVVQRLGRPTSLTITPDRRVLIYTYTQNNNVERQVVSSGAAAVGSYMAGPLGSLAGGLVGGSVLPANQTRDQVSIDVDPVTYTVLNVRREFTTGY